MGFERLLERGRGRKTLGKEKEGDEEGLERRAHSVEQEGGEEQFQKREKREVNKREKRQRANERERWKGTSGQCACIAVSFHSGVKVKKKSEKVSRVRYVK